MARNNTVRNSLPGLGLVVASILPAVLSSAPTVGPGAGAPTADIVTARRAASAKEFSISLGNLGDWANAVVVTLDAVTVEGHGPVHDVNADCEIHFGAHATSFQGEPDGLVLEPMNACIEQFPGKSEFNKADWTAFGDRIKGLIVTVSGVPRIWPEHLTGGGGSSNPNHAVELHPLTSLVSAGQTFDFAANVFAPEGLDGIQEQTALNIVRQTTVTVRKNGDSVELSFSAGRIGNFAVLDLAIDRTSIASDGAGSFRMNGEVAVDNSTTVPVRIVTARGSPINGDMPRIRSSRRAKVSMTALVLFSLSPESLLEAANRSNGSEVAVDRPIQLILYGPPTAQ